MPMINTGMKPAVSQYVTLCKVLKYKIYMYRLYLQDLNLIESFPDFVQLELYLLTGKNVSGSK